MKLKNFTPEIMKNCLKMNMGVELETLRVTAAGEMAKTPPPFREGDNLTRDFAENQMEINTPIYHSEKDARAYLNNTLREMRRTLAKKKSLNTSGRPLCRPYYTPKTMCLLRSIPAGMHLKPPTGNIWPQNMTGAEWLCAAFM